MILRDPVHGLMSFEGRVEVLVKALLQTREMQRLRRIKQLGLASLVFPGAEHSRFSHALGSLFLMQRLLERFQACSETLPVDLRVDEQTYFDALAAALLHDVGHGPFSHTFEMLFGHELSHESWGQRIVLDDSTDVWRVLQAFSAKMPERVASLLSGRHRLGYVCRALSGLIDVDRCDYLLRDSHMTGARYGQFDVAWLFRSMCFDTLSSAPKEPMLVIEGRRGLPPVEEFFMSRHAMYRQVYHHKATRAAECLMQQVFEVATRLALEDSPSTIVMPAALIGAIRNQPISIGDYLALDDVTLLYAVSEWSRVDVAELSDVSSAFINRALPKAIHLGDASLSAEQLGAMVTRAREVAQSHGFNPDGVLWVDRCEDVAYEEHTPPTIADIWVQTRRGELKPLSEQSFVLKSLLNRQVVTHRLICVEALRAPMLRVLEPLSH